METMVVAFFACLFFLALFDFILIWDMKRRWIDKKRHFPCWWEGYWDENKVLRWTIIWSIAISFNLVIYSVLSWIFLDASLVGVFWFVNIIIYFPILYFVYLIVKYQIIWRFEN